MSDVALAADRIRRVAGPRGSDDSIKVLLERAFLALSQLNDAWTRRRVRSLWHRTAARIEHREIVEMETAIARAEQLQKARAEHADFIAETEHLAARFAYQDEAFHGPEIEARRGIASGVDRAGNSGGGE